MNFPPAVSEFGLSRITRSMLFDKHANFDKRLCEFFGARQVIVANSWVKVLGRTLEVLSKKYPTKNSVVLTSFCCSEYVKAILQAELKPKFIDLKTDYTMSAEDVQKVVNEETLAVISINNTGVESDNEKIKEICRQNKIICIEDATYTYLGTSTLYPQKKFGSFGDFSVLNFSEGKTIPVGGGAVLLNNADFDEDFYQLKKEIYSVSPKTNKQEFKSLLIYKLGASRFGYELYQRLKKLIGVDFKSKFSMEPIRVSNPIDRDLLFTESREIIYDPERKKELENIQLRPFNRVKRLCGIDILENHQKYKAKKKKNLAFYAQHLKNFDEVGELIKMPVDAMLVKIPFNFKKEPSEELVKKLSKMGVIKQYPTVHPMYRYTEFANSRYFYECTFTLPIHKNIRRKDQLKIIDLLNKHENTSTL